MYNDEGSIAVSKFNAYFLHITGFHLHSAEISLTNVNVNIPLTQFNGFSKGESSKFPKILNFLN